MLAKLEEKSKGKATVQRLLGRGSAGVNPGRVTSHVLRQPKPYHLRQEAMIPIHYTAES